MTVKDAQHMRIRLKLNLHVPLFYLKYLLHLQENDSKENHTVLSAVKDAKSNERSLQYTKEGLSIVCRKFKDEKTSKLQKENNESRN